jgi:hypothetical protein
MTVISVQDSLQQHVTISIVKFLLKQSLPCSSEDVSSSDPRIVALKARDPSGSPKEHCVIFVAYGGWLYAMLD